MTTMKSEHESLPRDLANAVTSASSALVRTEKLSATLAEQGLSYCAALAEERRLTGELGRVEIEGGDTSEICARQTASAEQGAANGRRIAAAANGLLHADAELTESRTMLDRARSLYATGVIAEFTERCRQVSDMLAALRLEGEQLSRALGMTVTPPAPYTAQTNRITGAPEVRPVAPSGPIQPQPLPEALIVVSGIFDRLDSMRGLSQSIRRANEQTAHYFATSRERDNRSEFAGVFVVVKPFEIFGITFTAGMLVDRVVLLGEGTLALMAKGRNVRPLSAVAVGAAA
jgi:hypothetical protein